MKPLTNRETRAAKVASAPIPELAHTRIRKCLAVKARRSSICRLLVAALAMLWALVQPLQAQAQTNYPTIIDDGADLYRSSASGLGLPVWRVSEPFESLWIQYRAIHYTTSAGKTVNLDIAYRQRSPASNLNPFGFGPSWRLGWLATMQYDAEKESGVPWYTDASTWNLTPPMGGSLAYSSDPNTPEYNTYSTINYSSVTSCGTAFWITYPDGTVDNYTYRPCQSCSGVCDLHYTNYLSSVADPQGRTINLNYSTSSGQILLSSLVDYDGRTNLIYYDSTFSTNIAAIVDPYGRTNSFRYDNLGRLTNIINPLGMSTTFAYDSAGVITNMVTPYGTNVFNYTVNTNIGNLVNRSVQVTEPDGRNHLFIYRDQATYLTTNSTTALIPFSYPVNQLPNTAIFTNVTVVTNTVGTNSVISTNTAFVFANTFDNTWMDARDSFHWSPHCYAQLSSSFLSSHAFSNLTTNDYLLADMKHWMFENNSSNVLGNTASMQRGPSPDGALEGQKVWLDYWGKNPLVGTNFSGQAVTNFFSNGTNANPSILAAILPDGTTRFRYAEYNIWGKSTKLVETHGFGVWKGDRRMGAGG